MYHAALSYVGRLFVIWRGQHFWAGSAEIVGSNKSLEWKKKAVGLFWGALKREGEGERARGACIYVYRVREEP